MKNRVYAIASAMLILCVTVTSFSSCRKDKADITTSKTNVIAVENVTTEETLAGIENTSENEITTEVYTYNDSNGYTVYSYIEITNAPAKEETELTAHTEKTTSVPTTADLKEYPTVPEISKGLTCVRTRYASRGQIVTASVIMGTPDAEYTIEFYESENRVSDSKALITQKADSNGTVEWSFIIDDSCEIGNRKLVIREKGTDKYIQTFITVNG